MIYDGDSRAEAHKRFKLAILNSKKVAGRMFGKEVTLFLKGSIIRSITRQKAIPIERRSGEPCCCYFLKLTQHDQKPLQSLHVGVVARFFDKASDSLDRTLSLTVEDGGATTRLRHQPGDGKPG